MTVVFSLGPAKYWVQYKSHSDEWLDHCGYHTYGEAEHAAEDYNNYTGLAVRVLEV